MSDLGTAKAITSPTTSPAAKRVRRLSPEAETDAPVSSTQQQQQIGSEDWDENPELEADDTDADSAFGTDNSDSTSIASSIYAGYLENGRRYQTLREGEYWGPSDEKQFESMQAYHILLMILESRHKNNLFRSPIIAAAPNILDIGTGNGAWAVEAADRYPSALVRGVDLYPPPNTWVPPNCMLEVDDMLKKWKFQQTFDLLHLRLMAGSFTDRQWTGVYKQSYENMAPGAWIEQVEPGILFHSDDGSLPADSALAKWGPLFIRCAAKTEKNLDTMDTMADRIRGAGFINLQEKTYKVPIGEWTKSPILKEAGKFMKAQFLAGMEGYALFLLTKFGEPEPWRAEEVQVYLAQVRKEIETGGYHFYSRVKRVWAQKPL